jgi:hypothetical protein
METMYELVVADEDEKLVETDEPLDVGDAVAIDDEIWLVLRAADRTTTLARARFECRRALRLRNRAEALLAYAKELELSITKGARGSRPVANDCANSLTECRYFHELAMRPWSEAA